MPPDYFNWDLWQGQTPDVPYIEERTHYTFRWWYEYSGGQMTDWGAHHVDIAQWAHRHADSSGPVEIDGQATFPTVANGYNVATNFSARLRYADGVELEILDDGRNGILFEGDHGRIFVNRGSVSGQPVEELADDPLPRDKFTALSPTTTWRGPSGPASWTPSSTTWATSTIASAARSADLPTWPRSTAR